MIEDTINQPTLGGFGREAEYIHDVEWDRSFLTRNDPQVISQATAFLREYLGVDVAVMTDEDWASANIYRMTSRLHAQTAKFSSENAAHAIVLLAAALKDQRSRRFAQRIRTGQPAPTASPVPQPPRTGLRPI